MNAVIYARYSPGPRQTDQSIEGQVRDCMAYAKTIKSIFSVYMQPNTYPAQILKKEWSLTECCRLLKKSSLKPLSCGK